MSLAVDQIYVRGRGGPNELGEENQWWVVHIYKGEINGTVKVFRLELNEKLSYIGTVQWQVGVL